MFDHRTVSAPALSNHSPYILFNSFWCDMVLSGKFWVDNLCNPDGFIFHLHYKYHCISKILIPLILFTYTQPSDQTIHFLHFSLLHPLSCIRSLDRYRQYNSKKRRLRKFELFRESSRFFEFFRAYSRNSDSRSIRSGLPDRKNKNPFSFLVHHISDQNKSFTGIDYTIP